MEAQEPHAGLNYSAASGFSVAAFIFGLLLHLFDFVSLDRSVQCSGGKSLKQRRRFTFKPFVSFLVAQSS